MVSWIGMFVNNETTSYKTYSSSSANGGCTFNIFNSTTKTHKFENPDDITLEQLKLLPIIAQNGTYTYNAAQVIGDYLKPLISHNDYIIKNTQDFPKMLKVQLPLAEDEEYVS